MCDVLFVSHTPTATTGYGRVTRRLAHAFRTAGHRVAVVGSGYDGGPHELPYLIIPTLDPPAASVAEAIHRLSPDVLLTIGDPWMFEAVPDMPARARLKWVAYFPIDGYPIPDNWRRWIQSIDLPIVFSRFAQDLIAKATGTTPKLIYHGVDTESFFPRDRQRAKELAHVQGHFVVGTVARNQLRKNLPALVKAFAKFAADKPDALLYLHTQMQGDWDMQALACQFGIEDKTRITADITADRGVADPVLAVLYNAMDVFVLPTMAEGFGLPIMESQACGVPALVTDFSACPELVPDPIQRLKVKDTLVMHRNFAQAIVDVDDIVAKLQHFYENRDELKTLGQRCHQFAQRFEWSIACKQFLDLLGSLPTNRSSRPVLGQTAIDWSSNETGSSPPVPEPDNTVSVSSPSAPASVGKQQSWPFAVNDAKVFGYFDRAYVLNLDSDVERMSRVSARLKKLGIAHDRFAALTPPPDLRSKKMRMTAGAYACALSHRAILQLAWDRGEERVLIFEDDVVLRDDVGQWMQKIVPQLQAMPWDLFYMGLHLMKAGKRCSENLLQVLRGFHAHAYAANRQAIPRLIAWIDRILAAMAGTFDGFENPSLLKVCALPILAIQEPNHSHTCEQSMNRLGQYFDVFDGEDFCRNCHEMRMWRPTKVVSTDGLQPRKA